MKLLPFGIQQQKWPLTGPFFWRCADQAGVKALRIFFIAATSICRIRSALTPYSAAN